MPLSQPEEFGLTDDGERVERYVLNGGAIQLAVLTYGGIVQSLQVPDARGGLANVVLGFASLAGYLAAGNTYFGAVIGRYANRIAGAQYELDGQTVYLAPNEGRNHLHGGDLGFDKRIWRARADQRGDGAAVTLWRTSEDGEERFRGAVEVEVTYVVTADDTVRIEYRATATRATPISLTNHSLFNLAGEGRGTILGHELEVDAIAYTPVDDELIPTGVLAGVEGTPLDFRRSTKIGDRIGASHGQLLRAGGYDHYFVLHESGEPGAPRRAARLFDAGSGRMLEVRTTEPGIQVYTGNRLDGALIGTGGRPYERFAGVALETHRFPNSPNEPGFPSAVVRPGEAYGSVTEFRFGRLNADACERNSG